MKRINVLPKLVLLCSYANQKSSIPASKEHSLVLDIFEQTNKEIYDNTISFLDQNGKQRLFKHIKTENKQEFHLTDLNIDTRKLHW